jgi:putative ABC transport system ATP-binding protein
MASLAAQDLTVEFTSGDYVVRPLHNFSFSAADGELVVLLGPSGCGKTTLLSCLAGLLTPTSGTITLDGKVITGVTGSALTEYRRHTVGVVFQAFNLIPSLSARSNVMVPLRLAGVGAHEARKRADVLLEQVGLDDRGGHRPDQMSGGQQQRVAIARALVQDPPMVLADEPTAHLDYIQVEGILRLLRGIAAPGRLVIVATHDDRITRLADQVVELVPHLPEREREPQEVTLAAGQVLFEQGDDSDLVYMVESGEVETLRVHADGSEERLAVISAGSYFGELGPLLNLPRSATARALTDARLTGYGARMFRNLHPSVQPAHA